MSIFCFRKEGTCGTAFNIGSEQRIMDGLLSPTYELSRRGGCWFCPNAKLAEHRDIRDRYPEAWEQYINLENENVAFNKWNTFSDKTLHDIDLMLSREV